MKLNENNARFAVVSTAGHGGGTISFHNSLKEALKSKRHHTAEDCTCGCCSVVAITEEANKELRMLEDYYYTSNYLYKDLPEYQANGEYYGQLCR